MDRRARNAREIAERNRKIVDERSKISIPDPTSNLVSETNLKVGAEYTKKIEDLKVKIIMGREPMSSWDAFVASLKNDPQYMKINDEMNAV